MEVATSYMLQGICISIAYLVIVLQGGLIPFAVGRNFKYCQTLLNTFVYSFR